MVLDTSHLLKALHTTSKNKQEIVMHLGLEELYNKKHSSTRNYIKLAFRLLKKDEKSFGLHLFALLIPKCTLSLHASCCTISLDGICHMTLLN